MGNVKLLAAAGIAALLLGLLVTLPARVAYHWFAPDELALSGISGSAWNGRASAARAAGIHLADLEWRFHPVALFTGKAGYFLSARPAGGSLQAKVAVAPTGNITLRDVDAALPLRLLGGLAPMDGVEGNIALQLARVDVVDGFPVVAEGTVRLSNLVLRALSQRAIGDFRAEVVTGDDGIVGDVEDIRGVLDVTGNALLRPDGSYTFTGQLAPRADAPSSVVQQLQYLGSADAQGRREFRFEGSF